jgi:hypothetical protein
LLNKTSPERRKDGIDPGNGESALEQVKSVRSTGPRLLKELTTVDAYVWRLA